MTKSRIPINYERAGINPHRPRAEVITVPPIPGNLGRRAEILLSILKKHGPLHEREILDIWTTKLKRCRKWAPAMSGINQLCRIHATRRDDGRWAVP